MNQSDFIVLENETLAWALVVISEIVTTALTLFLNGSVLVIFVYDQHLRTIFTTYLMAMLC